MMMTTNGSSIVYCVIENFVYTFSSYPQDLKLNTKGHGA
jgi:hypothetical protein